MKLLSSSGNNFRSFKGKHSFAFDQPPGVYQLRGENGEGKSNFFECPYWVLFGKTTRGLKAANIHSWHTKGGTKGKVEIMALGEKQVIERSWNPNKLTLNGDIVEQHVIDDLIKLSPETMQHTILLAQFTEMFFDLKPAPRLDLISSVLDLDYWVECSSRASKKKSELDRELSTLLQSKAKLEGQLEEILHQAEKIEDLMDSFDAEKDKKIVDKKLDIKDIKKDIKEINEVIKTRNSELGGKDSDLDELNGLISELSKEYTEYLSEQSILKANIQTIDSDMRPIKRDIQKFESLGDICEECEQEIESKFSDKKLKAFYKELESKLKDKEILQKKLDKINQCLEEIGLDLKGVQADLDIIKNSRAKKSEKLLEAKNTLQNLDNELDRVNSELEDLKKSENPYEQQLDLLVTKSEGIEKLITSSKDKEQGILEIISGFEYWIKGFKELRLFVIEEILNTLEVSVNNYISDLGLEGWSIKFDIERENKGGGVNKGFHILIESPDSEGMVPWEGWSGGEAQRLRLAGTLGLSDLILQSSGIESNVLILDEPTQHMNKDGIQKLLNLLYYKAKDDQKQIWLIEHQAFDSGIFEKVYQVNKTEEGSKIS